MLIVNIPLTALLCEAVASHLPSLENEHPTTFLQSLRNTMPLTANEEYIGCEQPISLVGVLTIGVVFTDDKPLPCTSSIAAQSYNTK